MMVRDHELYYHKSKSTKKDDGNPIIRFDNHLRPHIICNTYITFENGGKQKDDVNLISQLESPFRTTSS